MEEARGHKLSASAGNLNWVHRRHGQGGQGGLCGWLAEWGDGD